jgi:transcriptional regulator with XRE-family HTH domain
MLEAGGIEMGPESFSVCLKRLRNATGLSQPRLAEKAGISVMALRNWEQGRREPYIGTAAKLAQALGVSLAEFDRCVYAGEEAASRTAKPRGRSQKGK